MKLPHLLAIALICSFPALAQESPPPSAANEAPGLQVRGLSFQLDSPPPEVFAHGVSGDGGQPGVKLEVKAYLNHEFSGLPIKGNSIIFTTSSDPAGVKDAAKIVAKVKVPNGFRTGIFMFLPGTGRAGDPPFQVLVIGDAKRDFPPGSVKVINLSPASVKLQLEKENFEFKPGETKLIKELPVSENHTAGMVAYANSDGQWQRIASGVWPEPGDKRVLQVMFRNPASDQIEIRGIRDVAAIRD